MVQPTTTPTVQPVQNATGDEIEEVIVTASLADYQRVTIGPGGTGSANMNLNTFIVNVRLEVQPVVDQHTTDAMRIVANALHGIATVLDQLLVFEAQIGRPLPSGERARLEALANSLEIASTGLKTGAFTEDSAHGIVKNAFATFFDLAGGYAVGLAMGALGAWAAANAPGVSLPVKALGAGAAGAFGFMLETTLGNSGVYNGLAEALTDALFWSGGAIAAVGQKLGDVLDMVMEAVADRINPFSGDFFDPIDLDTFELSPGPDDINGISSTFASIAVFETLPPTHIQVQAVFYRSSEGGPGEFDDYIRSMPVMSLPTEPMILHTDVVVA